MGKLVIWMLGVCFGVAFIHGDTFEVVLCSVITLAVMIGEIINETDD